MKMKMKTHLFPILLLLAGCCMASAQTERYVTITVSNGSSNQVSIAEGETAEVVSLGGVASGSFNSASFVKDGIVFNSLVTPPSNFVVVKGPVTFRLVSQDGNAHLTLKVMPESFPPDKTLILPPGTNQVSITLESSTNLVNWASATNGVYGSPDEARFFRIHLQKLN
jgi:hypothetical protein